jgi:hypothetical protein
LHDDLAIGERDKNEQNWNARRALPMVRDGAISASKDARERAFGASSP